MMYVLSEEEYAALKKQQQGDGLAMKVKRRQELCTKIAMTMPVTWGWGGPDPKPWGCHLDESHGDSEWPCDECPVTELCPAEKSWSK